MVEQAQAASESRAEAAGATTHEDTIAAMDAVVRRHGAATDYTAMVDVARALMSKAIVLSRLGRGAEELAAYDEVIRRYTMSPDAELTALVAMAHNRRGRALVVAGRIDEALTTFDLAWATATGWKEPQLARQAAAALYATGALRKRQGRTAEALSAWGDMVRQFGASEDIDVAAKLVTADEARVGLLRGCERLNDAIRVCNDMILRVAERPEPGFRAAIGSAAVSKMECLIEMESLKAVIEAGDENAARLNDDAGDPRIDRWRAGIEILRGRAFHGLGKIKEAVTAYSTVDREHRDNASPEVVEQVATALVELAKLLADQSEFAKARAFCDIVIQRYADSDNKALAALVKQARYQLTRSLAGMSDPGAALGALKDWVAEPSAAREDAAMLDGDIEMLRANTAFDAYIDETRAKEVAA